LVAKIHKPHYFTVSSTAAATSQLFKHTKTLDVRNYVWSNGYRFTTGTWSFHSSLSVCITKSLFPASHTLIVDGVRRDSLYAVLPLPAPYDVPNLRNVTFVRVCTDDPAIVGFLLLFRGALRHLIIEDTVGILKDFLGVLPDLGYLGLQELEVHDTDKCREEDRVSLATGVSREPLHVAAKTVVVNAPWDTKLTKLAALE
jgi:hypothetical protein